MNLFISVEGFLVYPVAFWFFEQMTFESFQFFLEDVFLTVHEKHRSATAPLVRVNIVPWHAKIMFFCSTSSFLSKVSSAQCTNFEVDTIVYSIKTRRPLTSRIFSVRPVLAMTYFWDSRVAIALWKRIDDGKRSDTTRIMSYHFRKKHFKNTSNTYLFFVGLCVYQNLTINFLNNFARNREKRQKWKFLLFRQLFGQLNNFSKKL